MQYLVNTSLDSNICLCQYILHCYTFPNNIKVVNTLLLSHRRVRLLERCYGQARTVTEGVTAHRGRH